MYHQILLSCDAEVLENQRQELKKLRLPLVWAESQPNFFYGNTLIIVLKEKHQEIKTQLFYPSLRRIYIIAPFEWSCFDAKIDGHAHKTSVLYYKNTYEECFEQVLSAIHFEKKFMEDYQDHILDLVSETLGDHINNALQIAFGYLEKSKKEPHKLTEHHQIIQLQLTRIAQTIKVEVPKLFKKPLFPKKNRKEKEKVI